MNAANAAREKTANGARSIYVNRNKTISHLDSRRKAADRCLSQDLSPDLSTLERKSIPIYPITASDHGSWALGSASSGSDGNIRVAYTADGIPYYINLKTKTTSWEDPRLPTFTTVVRLDTPDEKEALMAARVNKLPSRQARRHSCCEKWRRFLIVLCIVIFMAAGITIGVLLGLKKPDSGSPITSANSARGRVSTLAGPASAGANITVSQIHPSGMYLDPATDILYVSDGDQKVGTISNNSYSVLMNAPLPSHTGPWPITGDSKGNLYISGFHLPSLYGDFVGSTHIGLLKKFTAQGTPTQLGGSIPLTSLTCLPNNRTCPTLSTIQAQEDGTLMVGFQNYDRDSSFASGVYQNLAVYNPGTNTLQSAVRAGKRSGPSSMFFPLCMARGPAAQIYVMSDNGLYTINPDGTLDFLAGNPDGNNAPSQGAGYIDGQGAAARFNTTWNYWGACGMAVSPTDGMIYLADSFNNAIRAISPAGEVTTLAGSPFTAPGLQNGAGFGLSKFNFPVGVVYSPSQNILLVADNVNDAIRIIDL
ncbi:NHL repeat-containing protein 2 [Kappamyces sp. JEL0829]|nr:NHL repeat-containing protein 2 [Kappamyces sp. JEL0829]